MSSNRNEITKEARFFLAPEKPLHRQYEALRTYFVEKQPSKDVAQAFGYSPGAFRVLCSQFRRNPNLQERFFKDVKHGPCAAPKRDQVRELVVSLRKRNLSVYDIQRELVERGYEISINALAILLREEGFVRLPRRRDEQRPPILKPDTAPVADVRKLDLSPRRFRTAVAGLFLFLPLLIDVQMERAVQAAGLPGTEMIPAEHALRSLLALKLLGKERQSHVMDLVFDPGIALFAGLNAIPKRSYLSAYSARLDPRSNLTLMSDWAEGVYAAGLEQGSSFDLDFHTVPANSEAEPLSKHYLSRRSRSQKGILTFLVRDVQENVLCYAAAGVPKQKRNDEILRFVEEWKRRTGQYPEEVVFDSQLTTHTNLKRLADMNIAFITLRRRSKKMLAEILTTPPAKWRRITLPALTRQYRTPRILDSSVKLKGYQGSVRQLTVTDLGHEEPTLLLTNQLRRSAVQLITRYAQRTLIENGIAAAIDFFHLDALSSMVGLKVDFDLQLTLLASSLYRLMAKQIGREFRKATPRTLFRKLFDVPGQVVITNDTITVELARRAHNPLLIAAGFVDRRISVPWLGDRQLVLRFS